MFAVAAGVMSFGVASDSKSKIITTVLKYKPKDGTNYYLLKGQGLRSKHPWSTGLWWCHGQHLSIDATNGA